MGTDILYKYTFVSKIPYLEIFKYKDVFQVVPHELTIESENTLADYHYFNTLEVNLNNFYELFDSNVNIKSIFSNYDKFESNNRDTISLSEAGPLIVKEHYVEYPKWLILNLMSVVIKYKHFDYSEEKSDAWFMELPFKKGNPKWGRKMIPDNVKRIQSESSSISKTVERIDSCEYWTQVYTNEVKIKHPDDIVKNIELFLSLPAEGKECYLTSITIFNQALSTNKLFGSQSIVSFVTSIENLVDFTYKDAKVEKCECCQQDRYRVTKKFNDFIDLYSEGFYSRKGLKKIIGDVYAKRSSIVHKGSLFPHETSLPLWEEGYFNSGIIELGIESQIRYVLNQWLKKYSA